MNNQYEQVREFHQAFDQELPGCPTMLDRGPLSTNFWLTGGLYGITKEVKAISS